MLNALGYSVSRFFVSLVSAYAFFIVLPSPAHALEVLLATLQGEQVLVIGKNAGSSAIILWEGVQVTTATKGGTFNFTTQDAPASCVGEVSDGTQTLRIAVSGCTASGIVSPKGLALVPATGLVTSFAPGDDGDLKKGVPWPNPRFTDNVDGTVTDNLTGLIWLKDANCPGQPRTWQQALDFVTGINDGINNCGDTSNAGSHQTDWRLPNVRELHSLSNYESTTPPPGHPFSNFQNAYYWSSTSAVDFEGFAWAVAGGEVGFHHKSFSRSVIAVRGGS